MWETPLPGWTAAGRGEAQVSRERERGSQTVSIHTATQSTLLPTARTHTYGMRVPRAVYFQFEDVNGLCVAGGTEELGVSAEGQGADAHIPETHVHSTNTQRSDGKRLQGQWATLGI